MNNIVVLCRFSVFFNNFDHRCNTSALLSIVVDTFSVILVQICCIFGRLTLLLAKFHCYRNFSIYWIILLWFLISYINVKTTKNVNNSMDRRIFNEIKKFIFVQFTNCYYTLIIFKCFVTFSTILTISASTFFYLRIVLHSSIYLVFCSWSIYDGLQILFKFQIRFQSYFESNIMVCC